MKNNLLITSVGRRTSLIEYFKHEFKGEGEIHVTDCNSYAPALYFADQYHIVPKIDDPNYIEAIIDICRKHEIRGILSLIDPELTLLGKNVSFFDKENIEIFGSPYEESLRWYDKYESYLYCLRNGISMPRTYKAVNDALDDIQKGEINFPIMIKPRYGSASLGVNMVNNEGELQKLWITDTDQILQERISGKEYGVDCYVDAISNDIIDIFIKNKINMRSGETDKAVSTDNEEIKNLAKELLGKSGMKGPVDIDVLEQDGKYYILEVNPRFGGGYPLAYECGCNFPRYILNNFKGKINSPRITAYENGVIMMKHDRILLIRGENDGSK